MLIAYDAQKQVVLAEQAHHSTVYFCPGCGLEVQLKRGRVVRAHFAHRRGHCTTFSEGETPEHLLGKRQLATWFTASGYQVELEAVLPALHQRPDVLVKRGTQPPLALEFQCSPLSVGRLIERTEGYRQHGYRVLWLLGTPYQQRLTNHARALRFMQYAAAWGCYVLFWQVAHKRLQLCYHLRTLDTEPLRFKTHVFSPATASVQMLRQFVPARMGPPAIQTLHYQQLLTIRKVHRSGRYRQLQGDCYRAGGTLAQLPDWVIPQTWQLPLLATSYLEWYLAVFLKLRVAVTVLTPVQLKTLIWQCLQPQLATNACVAHRGTLHRQLVQALIERLVLAGVLQLTTAGWQVDRLHLQWKKD